MAAPISNASLGYTFSKTDITLPIGASIAFFLAGTEVRIRAEDRLLESRFHGSFRAYRSGTRAYIPFIR